MEEIKRIWPKWEIVEKLGEGGFGEVYKAKREILGEETWSAIKVVHIPRHTSELREMETSGLTEDFIKDYYKQSVNSYVGEIKTMELMKSASHIVAIEDYEVVENDEGIGWTIYIRMELLTNLIDYIKKHPMMKEDVIQLGIQLLTALEFCHSKNIIHRDIKPANIFVSPFGEFKLGDFGISKEVERTNATLSQKGTKSYMAPEMVSGRKYGKDVDLYALGLTMYELLNHNRMPFLPPYPQPFYPQDRDEAILRRLNGDAFPDIEGIGELNAIFKKACNKDPKNRYQSASDMKAALEAIATTMPSSSDKEQSKNTVHDETAWIQDDEKTDNIFDIHDKKSDSKTMKEYVPDHELEKSIVEYIIEEYLNTKGIDLSHDEYAKDMLYDEVRKQLTSGKKFPLTIQIPYITVNESGPQSLSLKVRKKDLEMKKKQTAEGKTTSKKHIDEENTQNQENKQNLEPLQVQCPYCQGTSYLKFSHGYLCGNCNQIHLTEETTTTLKLKALYEKVLSLKDADEKTILKMAKEMEKLDPHQSQVLTWIGSKYGSYGHEEKKIKYYHKALQYDQRDAVLFNNLAIIEIINAHYQKALEYYEKAYQLFIDEQFTEPNIGAIIYANYSIVLEKLHRSEEAFQFLLKAKRLGYDSCDKLVNDYDVGGEYIRPKIKEILERNQQHLSWSNRNIIDNLQDKETVYAFHMSDHTQFYMYISPSLLSLSANLKRGSGIREGLIIADNCIYFLSKKKNKGNYYASFVTLASSQVSFSKHNLTIEVPQKSGGKATFVVNVGSDVGVACKILKEIQKLYTD